MAGHTSYVRREPVGVVGQVTPWNYPMMMAVWKFAPALAAGNCVVLKPSDTTPVTTALMAEIAGEFFPPGVFNVVCGDRDTGRALVAHPTPAMVSITGSARAGYEVAEAAAKDLKRVHLELGGKAPVIVFDDADIADAAENIAIAGYFNAGQDCTAATRVLVGAADRRRLRRRRWPSRPATPRSARPTTRTSLYGPLNNANQLERVGGMLDRLPDHAQVLAGGSRQGDRGLLLAADRRQRPAAGRRGDPERDLRPGHHRAALHRRGRGDALGQRRRVRAGVLGLDEGPRPGDADDPRLDFGCVWVNCHIPLVAEMPHGGFKHSGYGKDLSVYGLEDYTRIKHVMHNIEA